MGLLSNALGCGLCRQVSFGMTYVEFNFIKFILSQYLAINHFQLSPALSSAKSDSQSPRP